MKKPKSILKTNPRPMDPTPAAPWPGISLPPQSPQPGFGFGPFTNDASVTSPASTSAANPWGALGDALKPQPTQPFDFPGLFAAMRNDPQGDANKSYVPGVDNASNPFSNGFFNFGAPSLSPEARLATQGGSAMNQWGQLGGVPGVDPTKLQNVMGQMSPLPSNAPLPPGGFSDPQFPGRLAKTMGHAPNTMAPVRPEVIAFVRQLYGL